MHTAAQVIGEIFEATTPQVVLSVPAGKVADLVAICRRFGIEVGVGEPVVPVIVDRAALAEVLREMEPYLDDYERLL